MERKGPSRLMPLRSAPPRFAALWAAATAQMFNAMVGSGLGEEDSIAVLKLLEKLSGQA